MFVVYIKQNILSRKLLVLYVYMFKSSTHDTDISASNICKYHKTFPQQYCECICEMWEQYGHINTDSRGFKAIWHPTAYGME